MTVISAVKIVIVNNDKTRSADSARPAEYADPEFCRLILVFPKAGRSATYGVFDLNVQVEPTTGGTGVTGKSKTQPPRVPRAPRGLFFLNTQVKNALNSGNQSGLNVGLDFHKFFSTSELLYEL